MRHLCGERPHGLERVGAPELLMLIGDIRRMLSVGGRVRVSLWRIQRSAAILAVDEQSRGPSMFLIGIKRVADSNEVHLNFV